MIKTDLANLDEALHTALHFTKKVAGKEEEACTSFHSALWAEPRPGQWSCQSNYPCCAQPICLNLKWKC